jgi:methylenetetrahydrofolate dehydrogenase (NAD+)
MVSVSYSVAPSPPLGKLLKAETIAEKFRSQIKHTLGDMDRPPRIVGILATSSAPSVSYADFTRKTCVDLGVQYDLRRVESDSDSEAGLPTYEAMVNTIQCANEDDSIDGIMVYYPIFGIELDNQLQQLVSPLKDVEGLHDKFHENLYQNIRFVQPSALASQDSPQLNTSMPDVPPKMAKSIVPCTPLAVLKALEHAGLYNPALESGDRAWGKTVTVINRSDVVGRPLAALLANDGARVFSVDIDSIQEFSKRSMFRSTPPPSGSSTPPSEFSDLPASKSLIGTRSARHVIAHCPLTLQECLSMSDVVISAVPSSTYKVPTRWLKDGCVCVNVAFEKNFETDVRHMAAIYIPAIGKVTILMLIRNLLRLCTYREILLAEAKLAPET